MGTYHGPVPARQISSTERAYRELKSRIVTCELPPGMELREATLSEELGLGRTPVREAMSRLVHEGLMEVRARQGYRVAPINLAQVHQLFEFRLILEPAAVELAVHKSTPEDLAALHDLAHQASRVGAVAADRYLSDHLAFHVALAKRSGNERLTRAIEDVLLEMERILRISVTGQVEPIGGEHHELYEALAQGDAAAAKAAMIDQIERSRTRVVTALISGSGQSGTVALEAIELA
jgi:DNA-binding GntR family transcriptional regulator